MRTMLTLGLGALALAATAHALPCDGTCQTTCATGAHGAHAPAAPHAGHAAQPSQTARAPFAVALTSSAGGGTCTTKAKASAPSCSSTAGSVAVAPSAGGGACQAGRTGELATAIDAAVGGAGTPAVLVTTSAPSHAAPHAGQGSGQQDQRSLAERVAELERALAGRAAPTIPAATPAAPAMPTLTRVAPVAIACPPAPPQAVAAPSPSADDLDWLDAHDASFWSDHEAFEVDAEAFEVDAEAFALEEGDGSTPFAFFGGTWDSPAAFGIAHGDCCDGDDPDCCSDDRKVVVIGKDGSITVGDHRVRIVTPDGASFESDGEVRIEIRSPDGKALRTETIRPGKVAVLGADGERVDALVRRLAERGAVVSGEQAQRVQEQVAQALARAGVSGEQAGRAAERAQRSAERAREQALRTQARSRAEVERAFAGSHPFPRFTPRPERGDADARDEALRDVHDLMKEMREEIEGLRGELRDMRRELREGRRDAHPDEDAIR